MKWKKLRNWWKILAIFLCLSQKFPSVHGNFIIQLHASYHGSQQNSKNSTAKSADMNNNARKNFFQNKQTWIEHGIIKRNLKAAYQSPPPIPHVLEKLYPLTRHHTFEIDCMQEKFPYSLAVFLLFKDVEDPYHDVIAAILLSYKSKLNG